MSQTLLSYQVFRHNSIFFIGALTKPRAKKLIELHLKVGASVRNKNFKVSNWYLNEIRWCHRETDQMAANFDFFAWIAQANQ